jgi:hypothetical protein
MAGGVLSLIVLVGGAFLFNVLFLDPLAQRRRTADTLRTEIKRKQERRDQVLAERTKLVRWRQQSLPGDTDAEQYSTTRRLYNQYLRDLMADCELAAPDMKVASQKPDVRTAPQIGKKPIYAKLTFTVTDARGNLAGVVKLLERFYRGGLLHQVKDLTVSRPRTRTDNQQSDDLDVKLTVEALVVNGVPPRDYLHYFDRRLLAADMMNAVRGGASGLGLAFYALGPTSPYGPSPLAEPGRRYEDLVARNVFFPAEERQADTEVTQFVFLTSITHNDKDAHGHENEALLYNRMEGKNQRLRVGSRAFDSFAVRDDQGQVVLKGTLVRLDDSDLYFMADGKYYVIHVGQNLEEALRYPVSEEKAKGKGVTGR